MSKRERDKGRRGATEAICILQERGFVVTEANAGRACEDIIARWDHLVANGTPRVERLSETYAVEVKNHATWRIADWRKQAKDNARKVKARYLLMCRIPGLPFTFYVEGQGIAPTIWRGNGAKR